MVTLILLAALGQVPAVDGPPPIAADYQAPVLRERVETITPAMIRDLLNANRNTPPAFTEPQKFDQSKLIPPMPAKATPKPVAATKAAPPKMERVLETYNVTHMECGAGCGCPCKRGGPCNNCPVPKSPVTRTLTRAVLRPAQVPSPPPAPAAAKAEPAKVASVIVCSHCGGTFTGTQTPGQPAHLSFACPWCGQVNPAMRGTQMQTRQPAPQRATFLQRQRPMMAMRSGRICLTGS
jgi:hypothetical protein